MARAKDYENIAAILLKWRKSAEIVAMDSSSVPPEYGANLLAAVVCDLADYFASQNPRFDRNLFHIATQIEEHV